VSDETASSPEVPSSETSQRKPDIFRRLSKLQYEIERLREQLGCGGTPFILRVPVLPKHDHELRERPASHRRKRYRDQLSWAVALEQEVQRLELLHRRRVESLT
jgi:hypothetical protein